MAQSELVKSISYDQREILAWIIRLYLADETFEVDATYSKGGFYAGGFIKKPQYCFDIAPQKEECIQADCRHLPLGDGSVASIILDPPFLATTGKSLATTIGNKMLQRFGAYPNEKALQELYQDAIQEAHRVLKDDGILVIKCQDKVSSGKQYMMHCMIHDWAKAAGFDVEDLFVLLAKNRLVANWQRNQKHSRKFHSYFWVFRKRRTS